MVGHIFELGGANKGEVARVEHHDRPLSFERSVGDFAEFSVLISVGFKRFDGGFNQ